MSYTASDAMRENGYSDEEVEISQDTGTVEDYLDSYPVSDECCASGKCEICAPGGFGGSRYWS